MKGYFAFACINLPESSFLGERGLTPGAMRGQQLSGPNMMLKGFIGLEIIYEEITWTAHNEIRSPETRCTLSGT